MKNTKNKKKAIIISAILLLIILVSGLVYAKYISMVKGTGSLQIAKWSFLVNNEREDFGELDLGEQKYNVKTISDGLIAPGTKGSFEVNINAEGTETGIDYTVKIDNIMNKPENLYFKVGNVECNTINELETALSGHFDADDTEKNITKTVEWIWDYNTVNNGKTEEENDRQDTIDGENANNFTFNILVTGTQVQPV